MNISADLPRLVTPQAALDAFTAALARADLEAAAACFCRDARLLTADRTAIRGRREIAALLAQLIDTEAQLDFTDTSLVKSDLVALLRGRCRTRSKGPDLFWLTQTTDLTAVIRLVEGDWKLAILAPWERDHTTEIGD